MAGSTVTEEQIREIARKIGEQPGVVQVPAPSTIRALRRMTTSASCVSRPPRSS